MQQAALTGEPLPAEKEAAAGPAADVRDPAGMSHVEGELIAVTGIDRVRIVDGVNVVADHPRRSSIW